MPSALLQPLPPFVPLCPLQEGSRRPGPFLFSTAKGFTGHQEAGAGVAGLMEAALLVQHAAVGPAVSLRNLNPHVFGALQGHSVAIARGGPYAVPSSQRERPLLLGVSSFGAQGTNAHALVGGSGAAAALGVGSEGLAGGSHWRPVTCWVAPRFQVGGREI